MNTQKYENIHGIFFDLGWTLEIPANGDWMLTDKFRSECSREGLDSISSEEMRGALAEGFKFLQKNHKMTTAEEEYSQFTVFYENLGRFFPQLGLTHEKAEDISYDRTYNMANYVLLEDAVQTLETLKKRGFKLGVISDTWPDVLLQLRHFKIIDYFDSLTFSYQLGVFKPDQSLFRDALGKINLPAAQTVFVDDMAYILDGARQTGIKPVQSLVEPEKQADSRFPSVKKPSEILSLVQ